MSTTVGREEETRAKKTGVTLWVIGDRVGTSANCLADSSVLSFTCTNAVVLRSAIDVVVQQVVVFSVENLAVAGLS